MTHTVTRKTPRERLSCIVAGLCALATLVGSAHAAGAAFVRLPMVCSRGGQQWFTANVTMPESTAPGARITVRVESLHSGRISHFGLHYLYNMATDLRLSAGTTYVEGSARVVPGTGTPNVSSSARISHDAAGIHMLLTARVPNDSSYTPPTVEFDLMAVSEAPITVEFAHYAVMANAFLVGDIRTTCEPAARPATIGTTRIVAPVATH